VRTKAGTILKLRNPIRDYTWGSKDGLSLWAGIKTDGDKPAGEYWMGSHPAAPSFLLLPDGGSISLSKYIRDYPNESLGEKVFAQYGDLPFLFKVLSAAMPLSIQVHPDKKHAETGFEREEKQGIPRSAPERTYKDKNHKPELAVALSSFSALCGFRNPVETAALLGPRLCRYFGFSPLDAESSLRRLLKKILSLDDTKKRLLEEIAIAQAEELVACTDEKSKIAGKITLMCVKQYPQDPGAIAPFFMNVLFLEPGQGIYIPAGVMHAYLEGTILEIMASSDNVIRGGLTHKHIDADELLKTIDFSAKPILIEPAAADIPTEAGIAQEWHWQTPAQEFLLSRIILSESERFYIRVLGPEILLCTKGQTTIDSNSAAEQHMALYRGESVFINDECRACVLRGPGVVYRARVGRDLNIPKNKGAAQ
jgi:mannose-6-phosphate isomerase